MKKIIDTSKKPFLIISGSILIGFMLGYFVNGMMNYKRINDLIHMNTEQGIKERYQSLLDPKENQKQAIDSLIAEYAQKNQQFLQMYSDSLNQLKIHFGSKLAGKLDPAQKRKVDNAKILTVNQLNKEKKGLRGVKMSVNTINLMAQDSISKVLIDSLKNRRKELRHELVNRKIDDKIDAQISKLTTELTLTDHQAAELKNLHLKYALKLDALKKDTSLIARKKILEMRKLKLEFYDQVQPILDERQFEKYKNIMMDVFREKYKSEKAS
jgi:hypothetical protein